MSATEFSVVWRWRTDPYRDEFSKERRKVYKTMGGAMNLVTKLTSNGGNFEKHTEVEPTHYEDGLIVEHWTLDYARLETHEVGPWLVVESTR